MDSSNDEDEFPLESPRTAEGIRRRFMRSFLKRWNSEDLIHRASQSECDITVSSFSIKKKARPVANEAIDMIAASLSAISPVFKVVKHYPQTWRDFFGSCVSSGIEEDDREVAPEAFTVYLKGKAGERSPF